jgi:hypothetical protein
MVNFFALQTRDVARRRLKPSEAGTQWTTTLRQNLVSRATTATDGPTEQSAHYCDQNE